MQSDPPSLPEESQVWPVAKAVLQGVLVAFGVMMGAVGLFGFFALLVWGSRVPSPPGCAALTLVGIMAWTWACHSSTAPVHRTLAGLAVLTLAWMAMLILGAVLIHALTFHTFTWRHLFYSIGAAAVLVGCQKWRVHHRPTRRSRITRNP